MDTVKSNQIFVYLNSKNVFMYGNTDEEAPQDFRVFPYILSKICSYFSFTSSKFAVQKSKISTARITMWKELLISSIYTIEASFLGPTNVYKYKVFILGNLF